MKGFQAELEAVEAGLRCISASGNDKDIQFQVDGGVEKGNWCDLRTHSCGCCCFVRQAARKLRELLSTHREQLIQHVLERNWVPLLLDWLKLYQRPAVQVRGEGGPRYSKCHVVVHYRARPLIRCQVEALWALTNIAAGAVENTQVLIKHGAIPTLVSLLGSINEEVLEQAMWVLGNLAGEGTASRDAVLGDNAFCPIIRCLQRTHSSLSLLRIGSWTLSNLCDGQPRPAVDIHLALPVLTKLLQSGLSSPIPQS